MIDPRCGRWRREAEERAALREPMMHLAALRRCVDAGQTLEAVLARLDAAVSAAVPPLSLAAPDADGQTPA